MNYHKGKDRLPNCEYGGNRVVLGYFKSERTVTDTLRHVFYSVEHLTQLLEVSGSLWEIFVPELMFLFDAPGVCVNLLSKDNCFFTNMTKSEHQRIVSSQERRNWREKLKKTKKIHFATKGLNHLIKAKKIYEATNAELRKTTDDAERERKIKKLNERVGIFDPRLLDVVQIVIVPLLVGLLPGAPVESARQVGSIELYLDKSSFDQQAKKMRKMLTDSKKREKFLIFLSKIYDLISRREEERYQEAVSREMTEEEYTFLAKKLAFLQKPEIRINVDSNKHVKNIQSFMRQFEAQFGFINQIYTLIHSNIKSRLPGDENFLMTFLYGEKIDGAITENKAMRYFYLFPLNQTEKLLSEGQNKLNLDEFQELWTYPWEPKKSIIASIIETGCPCYTYDSDNDIRVGGYASHIKELEDRMCRLLSKLKKWKCVFETPLVVRQTDGQREVRAVILYFSKEPPPMDVKRILFESSLESSLPARQAVLSQNFYAKALAREKATDWMHFVGGLSHGIGNEVRSYEAVLPLVPLLIQTVSKSVDKELRGRIHREFLKQYAAELSALYEDRYEISYDMLESIVSKDILSSLSLETESVVRTNRARGYFIDFLRSFARIQRAGKDRIPLDGEKIEVYPFIMEVRKKIADIESLIRPPKEKWLYRKVTPIIENECKHFENINKGLLHFVCYELMKNAINYSSHSKENPEGDRDIEFRFRREGPWIVLTIVNDLNIRPDYVIHKRQPCSRCEKISSPLFNAVLTGGKEKNLLCDSCFKDMENEWLRKTWLPAEGSGTGLGLFMINFFLSTLFGNEGTSGIEEPWSNKTVFYQVSLPFNMEKVVS